MKDCSDDKQPTGWGIIKASFKLPPFVFFLICDAQKIGNEAQIAHVWHNFNRFKSY